MSNPTTPFSWQMPENTDLVTDLPADFEVFGQAVATSMQDLLGGTTGQVLAKASNTDMDFVWSADAAGMTNPMTTTGDVIYSSPNSTPARLGIGTANQQLRVNSGANAPEWFTPAASGGISWSLLNSGGTALTAAATITISGISGKNHLMILVQNASSANAASQIYFTFNSDTGANYGQFGQIQEFNSSYSQGNAVQRAASTAATLISLGSISTTTSDSMSGYCLVSGTNTSAPKIYQLASGSNAGDVGGSAATPRVVGGYYTGSSVISSVSIISADGNFDAGTIFIYGSA